MNMKDSRTQLLTEEIKAATHLLEKSWNSAYREAYLHGKIYAYKKLLELEEKKSYNLEHGSAGQ
jgi:hypothetical protein